MSAATLFVIAGPTATGKTAAAIAVARDHGAVIVSADAMQVYRGMDIGTAKATADERSQAVHFGIDVVNPDEPFDAAAFLALTEAVRADHARVVVCGGTSLYVRALLHGLVDAPSADPELRRELDALADPHAELARVDPALAARLHPNDRVRIVRGLEVFRLTGRRLSALHDAHAAAPTPLDADGVWLDHPDVAAHDARIAARTDRMIADGYVDEVRGLLAAGYPRTLKPMSSLGYRHLCDHLLDGLALDEAVRRTVRDTRRFARKQRTWRNTLRLPAANDVDQVRAAADRAFAGRRGVS